MDGLPFRSTDAVKLTSHADQVMTALLRQPGVTYDEDCLTLNIWTKSHSDGEKKAVLFWIYGGGYNTGTTNNAGYNGKYLADHEDVVVVTIK
jgi:carboxylesterase type B